MNAIDEKLNAPLEVIYEQVSLSRSLELRAGFYQTLLGYIKQISPAEINIEVSKSFKAELASVLEGFVRVLRADAEDSLDEERTKEVEELRKSLAEAKDKIIVLLTEQNKDRAKIARLETEVKFLPDLQSQADRALALVNGAGNLQEELIKLRTDLNNAHLSRIRSKLHGRPRRVSWLSRLRSQLRLT